MFLIFFFLTVVFPTNAFPFNPYLSTRVLKQIPFYPEASNRPGSPFLKGVFQLLGQASDRDNEVVFKVSGTEELDLNTWLTWQSNQSFFLMLENIGGVSTNLLESEVKDGMIIASQSRVYPNYFFNWIRDSALTVRSLLCKLKDTPEQEVSKLKAVIESYIEASYHLQREPNRSGKFDDSKRSGLGEPKFEPNGNSFLEKWGRPQSDGPALRISTITSYIDYLESSEQSIDSSFLGNASNIYHRIIKPDLEYVMQNWEYSSFDLWEEVKSTHFFNALVQLRCLKDGMRLARSFDTSPTFLILLKEHFENLNSFILDSDTGFRSKRATYIVETPSLFHQKIRSGLDSATLLASLYAHDTDPGDAIEIPFDVDDSHILNTFYYMVTDMKVRYPVNHKYIGKPPVFGVGLGRYPEDVYDGYATTEGNPWFICTASASEVLYKLVYKRIKEKSAIEISAETKEFYSLFVDDLLDEKSLSEGPLRIIYGSERYKKTMKNIFTYSDTFMEVIRDHIDSDGHMSEQFNRNTGYMQGAKDLTWSYSSFYDSVRWRTKAQEKINYILSNEM
ncbi:hypothetical protein JCM33374_g166 [Metschnikowia sp. JCM 33374]|nr:hypothetical protein JCM33374_g166 [Metschnikowia sp. JCM 33374]